MEIISKSINTIKKNRISIISITVFAVALCCIFAFAGNSSDASTTPSETPVSSETASETLLSGQGIYVDGEFVAALSDASDAEAALKAVLNSRISAFKIPTDAETTFVNSIEIVPGDYSENMFVDKANAITLLSGLDILDYKGNALNAKFSVTSILDVYENIVIEHDTKTVYTDSMRNGAKKVVKKGYDGVGKETYRVTAVNGVETERTFVSLEVTTAPVDEEIRIGTRRTGSNVASLKKFVKPCEGFVTSYMGERWGRIHHGIDIAKSGCHGDPVVAAYGGTVVVAEYHASYGNYVIIDHGDGIQTLYAHFSKPAAVKVGDVVSAGSYIGNVGATGRVTGPHLHFEVRVDGEYVDPILFVDYD